jgi:hypothetical protein
MADSDLQAALHQSKVFDLNQVGQGHVFFLFALILNFFRNKWFQCNFWTTSNAPSWYLFYVAQLLP